MNHRLSLTGARLRKIVQAACLALFCLLLGTAGKGGMFGLPADLFLRLDPLVGTAIPIAERAFIATLLPALIVIAVAVFAGRVFCGWVCPMGTTLDAAGALIRSKRKKQAKDPLPRHVKYLLLAAVLASALFGVNMAFWASPIPLVTRLYALVLYPLGLSGLDQAVAATGPFLDRVGLGEMQYRMPNPRGYHTAWFVATFWICLIILERVRPRFWCRYLCPAGALLGVASRFAVWKRRAGASCDSCGRCAPRCPSGILDDPRAAPASECLACRGCVTACKKKAVSFGLAGRDGTAPEPAPGKRVMPSRRAFCGALAAGAALAGATRLDAAPEPHEPPVRPPGSVPEAEFLARCVRCGACMQACPTGGLQPAWLQAGFSGMFSPFLDPRSGPCTPECAACGAVCPSRAIQALPVNEKRWAKIGTAVVDRTKCIAWAEDKRCMVCQETCPYAAVSVVPQAGRIAPVPVVKPERCYGCGFCEKHCPTASASIRVAPLGALRQHGHEFEAIARSSGLELDPSQHAIELPEYDPLGGGAPPGFLE